MYIFYRNSDIQNKSTFYSLKFFWRINFIQWQDVRAHENDLMNMKTMKWSIMIEKATQWDFSMSKRIDILRIAPLIKEDASCIQIFPVAAKLAAIIVFY